MKTPTNEQTETNKYINSPTIPNLATIKVKQKATWESGDFGQIARVIENVAEEFMGRLLLQRGMKVLDVACGTGNLAMIAARHGCITSGIDIAANLLEQARVRAVKAGLGIEFTEADAETLPFADNTFDLAVSMFGAMFAPQPAVVTAELQRVTKPGGQIAMANWTLEGFIGKMFRVFKAHLPPPPAGLASPMEWGNEATVQKRLQPGFTDLQLTRRIAWMRFPFPPAETVEFFRKYYGPTNKAFESLPATAQDAFRKELVELQTSHNTAKVPGTTEVAAEYLEVIATKT
jgi:SAM-dependent methyltransferase